MSHLVTKCSFRHNLTGASKQKTYLTKVVKEYALMKKMLCNVYFVTILTGPLMRMGVLYHRVRDFYSVNLQHSAVYYTV